MRVTALQLYLRSLQSALTATDAASSIPAELESVCVGLSPFAELEISQFAAFLRQAEGYRASGAVSVPSQASLVAEKVQPGLQAVASVADRLANAAGSDARSLLAERDSARQELEQALAAFLKPLAVGVALKDDRKGFEAAVRGARIRTIARELRHALAGAQDEAALNDPARKEKLSGIVDRLDLADLKEVAVELGMARPTVRTKEAVFSAIVEKLTGIKPTAAKGRKPAAWTAAVDHEAVRQQAVRLKELLEKSVDPDGLSPTEVDTALAELGRLKEAELRALAEEAGLQNVGKRKADILKKIRLKLTEARRAQESIQV